MQEADIINLLMLVGEELEAFGLQRPIRILLIGGAYMLTQVHNRLITRDVDVIIRANPESREYNQLKQAATFVAQDTGADRDWLSDNIADFITSAGKVPPGHLWLSHGMLQVYIPDESYILALKLLSGRDKDENDIHTLLQRLNIRTRKQAEKLLNKYLNKSTREEFTEDIQETLDDLFG